MAKQTVDKRINLYINGKEVANNIKAISGQYKKSKNELAKLTRGTEEYNRKAAEVRKLRGYLDEHNQQLRKTETRWQKLGNKFREFMPMLGVGAAVMGARRLVQFQQQLEKTRQEMSKLTGLTGEALDTSTAKAQSIADTYNESFQEIIKSGNALAKSMKISHEEAFDVIQDGFVAGANSSGEYLKVMQEYPALLEEVGLNAQQMNSVITQQVKSGVFSDKGIDAIKEANIRIREMPKATKEALDSIGLSSQEIQQQLESGEKSMFEVIQQVSGKLSELPPQSEKVGKSLADIFGGPGEDAGIEYIKTLKDVDMNMESVMDSTNEYQKQQEKLMESNENLNKSFNDVFGSADGIVSQLKVTFNNLIASIISGYKTIEQIRRESMETNISNILAKDQEEIKKNEDAFVNSLKNQIEMEEKRLETGVKNIHQLELERETYGEVRSAAKYLSKQEQEAMKEDLKLKRKRLKEAKKYIRTQEIQKENTEEQAEETKEVSKAKEKAIRKEEQLAEKIKEIRRDLQLSDMSDEAKEIQQVQWKYDKLIKEAEGYSDKQKQLEELRERELQNIRDKYEQKRIESKKEAEKKIEEVLMSSKEKEINDTVEKYQELIKLARKYGFDTAELYEKLNQELDKIAQEHQDGGDKRDIFGMTDEDWSNAQEKIRTAQQMAGELSMAWSAYNRMRENQMQKELDQFEQTQQKQKQAVERRLEAGIISEEEAKQRKAQLEEELNQKKAEMAKEQAKREKTMKTFQAIVDTAAAIIGYLADPGGVLGIALSAMAGATGAAQVAAIQSQPVPQYEEGGRVKKNQVIEVAEGDKEEGILSNKTLTDPETGPMANYLLDKQAGVANAMPDAGAIDQAADFNNFKRNGGGYNKTENVTNNYITNQQESESTRQMAEDMHELKNHMKDPSNRRAYISDDIQKEHDEEQQILDEINTMK